MNESIKVGDEVGYLTDMNCRARVLSVGPEWSYVRLSRDGRQDGWLTKNCVRIESEPKYHALTPKYSEGETVKTQAGFDVTIIKPVIFYWLSNGGCGREDLLSPATEPCSTIRCRFPSLGKGIKHTKKFGIYHWDTFELPGRDTFLIGEADTLEEAEVFAHKHYGDRLHRGADRVEIVNSSGDIVRQYSVG